MNSNLIDEFLDKHSLSALDTLINSNDEKEFTSAACTIADAFGADGYFEKIADSSTDAESKLISSFHKNLLLLVQKTWVEKSDEDLKAQALYHLEQFCQQMESKTYTPSYLPFLSIVDDVVYLMFGSQSKNKEFIEYALRIDPEFGIFWWYVQSLPRSTAWSESKSRIAILLGMYFLANY
jgi:hypothetical protein